METRAICRGGSDKAPEYSGAPLLVIRLYFVAGGVYIAIELSLRCLGSVGYLNTGHRPFGRQTKPISGEK